MQRSYESLIRLKEFLPAHQQIVAIAEVERREYSLWEEKLRQAVSEDVERCETSCLECFMQVLNGTEACSVWRETKADCR